jgi:hypothetical protein
MRGRGKGHICKAVKKAHKREQPEGGREKFIRKFEEIVSRVYGCVFIFHDIASSVADPGCLYMIPVSDPTVIYPGS